MSLVAVVRTAQTLAFLLLAATAQEAPITLAWGDQQSARLALQAHIPLAGMLWILATAHAAIQVHSVLLAAQAAPLAALVAMPPLHQVACAKTALLARNHQPYRPPPLQCARCAPQGVTLALLPAPAQLAHQASLQLAPAALQLVRCASQASSVTHRVLGSVCRAIPARQQGKWDPLHALFVLLAPSLTLRAQRSVSCVALAATLLP